MITENTNYSTQMYTIYRIDDWLRLTLERFRWRIKNSPWRIQQAIGIRGVYFIKNRITGDRNFNECNLFEVFSKTAQDFHVSRGRYIVRNLHEVRHGCLKMFFPVIFNAHNVEGIRLHFLFYELVEFTLVLKRSVDALKIGITWIQLIRKWKRDFKGNGFVGSIIIGIQFLKHNGLVVVSGIPIYTVIAYYIKCKDEQEQYGGSSSHRVWVIIDSKKKW